MRSTRLLAGDYAVQQGSTLQATLVREGASVPQGWAINDVVVRSGMRMVDIEIYIDGHYVNTYPGDGMIVATPHGSTAYCMAAGGPILTAGVKGFAIVPISCHSPIRTPFVVSEEAIIEMVVANDHDSALILDGREQAHLGTVGHRQSLARRARVQTRYAEVDELLRSVPHEVQFPNSAGCDPESGHR